MLKRTLQILAFMFLITALIFSFWPAGSIGNGEAAYVEWHKPRLSQSCIAFLVRHLPGEVSGAFGLPERQMKYWAAEDQIRDNLLASGYLTNVSIPLANTKGSSRQICERLWKATRKNGAKWAISIPPGKAEAVLTCRPQDVDFCQRVIETN